MTMLGSFLTLEVVGQLCTPAETSHRHSLNFPNVNKWINDYPVSASFKYIVIWTRLLSRSLERLLFPPTPMSFPDLGGGATSSLENREPGEDEVR